MKTLSKATFATLCLMTPAIALATVTGEPLKTKPAITSPAPKTVTVTATIVKIDYRTGIVVLKDKSGKTYEVTVAAKSGINLRLFKVGDTVEATLAYVTGADTPAMRARISKQELIRLQKK
jgi:hypothetical protein